MANKIRYKDLSKPLKFVVVWIYAKVVWSILLLSAYVVLYFAGQVK